MPCQPFGLTAFGGDDVDVVVAGVLTAEGDPLAIRGEVRILSLSLKAGDAASRAARAFDYPDVVCVGECDVRRADTWRAQQPSRWSICRCDSCRCECSKRGEDQACE